MPVPRKAPLEPQAALLAQATRRVPRALAGLAILLALLPAPPARGQGTVGSSSAFDQKVSLKLTLPLGLGASAQRDPVAEVSGDAPPAYTDSASASETGLSLLGSKVFSTSQASSSAQGTLEGVPLVSARVELEIVEVALAGLVPLLTLASQNVAVDASVSGPCGDALSAAGTTSLSGTTIGGALGFGVTVPADPSPNTVLINQAGVRLVLNERILTGSSFDSLKLAINGIHIQLDEALVAGLGTLTGDFVFGHAEAELICGDDLDPDT